MKNFVKFLNDDYPEIHKIYDSRSGWIRITFPDMHSVIFRGNEIHRLDIKRQVASLWLEHNKKVDQKPRSYHRNDYRPRFY